MGHYARVTDPSVNDGRSYEAYIPSRLQDIQLRLSPTVATKIDRATRSIAAIDARLGQSSSLPALEALIKSEAIASSYIEGHLVSAAELARSANDFRSASADVRAVLGNIEATHRAVRIMGDPSRAISAEDVVRIQSDLMEAHPRGGARSPYNGFRNSQAILIPPNALRGELATIADATHIPPPASHVGGAMADLLDYINTPPTDAPPLVRAALVHAQFETIHPFPDGNGRTGRALIQAMLRRDGAVRHAVLPLSPYLAMNSDAYVQGLNSVRFTGLEPDQEALGAWFEMFADCAYSAALNAAEAAQSIELVGEVWTSRLRNSGVRTGAAAYSASDYLLGAIATTTRDLAAKLDVGEDTARTALRRLEKVGAVSATKTGDGTVVFVADEVAGVIAHSQRDIAVIQTPPVDDVFVNAVGVAIKRPAPSRTSRGKVCGAPMPRSRTHCNLPEGHAGWPTSGHRHVRR
ncbi:Fic family protein [Demequina lutea]|uniref:Fic family protein n=1 Tax=Demequina lutea TaxID=431489 RepID=A0A7Y9ZCV6_9MICO|nr:Fic family protein [Demequina lutea]NYI41873.1 Fic family protein [Demequina lutea]